jgi:tetratricopeptide (TPR) repeat protein
LTEGEFSWTSQTASGLLGVLAGWFNNPRDREIAKKIITKAEEMAPVSGNVLDLHFSLSEKLVIYYRERETTSDGLEKAIQACKDQITIAPQAARAFLKEYPKQPLPAHGGYRQLRIILEKQGKYDEAIKLCEQAKLQGWADNWDKQIVNLKKKKQKST